ncbi:glycine receptor subunit alpha-1-like [Amphibalanus amphitrite]|nr:glycine receptor subunit alpha-1-like [Amphibalanus amphitrite]
MLRTRLLLNCTNLLTIISMYLSVSKTEAKRVPKVSYVTALNLWMFVTVAFCFSSVLLVILDIRLVVLLTNPGRKLETLLDFVRPKNTPEPSVQLYLEDEDEEGDEFADASDVTPELSGAELTEQQLRVRVAEKRVEWLARTAGFEQVYLVGYPVLFVLFLLAYFGHFLSQRKAKMTSLMSASQSNDTLYPGCYCLLEDFDKGCMTEQDYIDNQLT